MDFTSTGKNEVGQDISDFDAPDISPQGEAEHIAQLIAGALEKTSLVEVAEVRAVAGQVHILARVKKENERAVVHQLAKTILVRTRDICDSHIGKNYFLKGNKMVYGWAFSFGSNDLKNAAHAICGAIDEVSPRMEVLEAPLLGPGTPSGGVNVGKGASLVRG